MMDTILTTRIVLRNDTLANWESNSSIVLLRGEAGVAYDVDGSARIKLGDGVKTWAELDWYGGDITTITNTTEAVIQEMVGIPANPETGAEATGIYKELADIVTSTDAKIESALTEKLGEITDNGKIDTIKEFIDYVEVHSGEAKQILHDLTELQALVGSKPVSDQIVDVLTQQNILGKDVNDSLYQDVKFEVTSLPDGAVVDYKDSEIRVMCPVDTVWTKQSVGNTGNENMYYMGFKAYAPVGAVSFKEGDRGVIIDEMFTFDSAFAGTDVYGRNYSICWLALASYNEEAGAWKYFGETSNASKYIGWDYIVEWYDANGKMISADSIRINLSNESCHNTPVPYYMGNVIKEISVNGALVDVVNNRAEITVKNIVKDGDEIAVNEDGSLRIVSIDASKLVTSTTTTIVLNGGNAAV